MLAWLRKTGARRVAVHFDLDVLGPASYDFLLFHDPSAEPHKFDGVGKGRMHLSQVSKLLNEVDALADVVGLAIAEYVPWSVIRLARALERLAATREPEKARGGLILADSTAAFRNLDRFTLRPTWADCVEKVRVRRR